MSKNPVPEFEKKIDKIFSDQMTNVKFLSDDFGVADIRNKNSLSSILFLRDSM